MIRKIFWTMSLMFSLLILLPSILAAQPVTEIFTGTTGFEVEYTPIHLLKQNTAFTFTFHVFNLTGGQQLVKGIGCTFSLFNSIGDHIVVIYEDETQATGDHFEFIVGKDNFSDICLHVPIDIVDSMHIKDSGFTWEILLHTS